MMLLVGSGLTNSTHDGGHHPLTAGENEHLSTSGSVLYTTETKQAIPSILLLFIVLILNTGHEDTLSHKGAAVLHKEFNYVLCNFLINLLMSLQHPQTLHNGNVLGQLHSSYQ